MSSGPFERRLSGEVRRTPQFRGEIPGTERAAVRALRHKTRQTSARRGGVLSDPRPPAGRDSRQLRYGYGTVRVRAARRQRRPRNR